MENILVPTDFSNSSDLALEYAVHLAQMLEAKVTLIHACTLLDDRFSRHKSLIREANEVQLQSLKAKLEEVKQQASENWGFSIEVRLFETDNITECIVSMAESSDLVVMGSHGKTGLRRRLFGSKAADVINRCHKPVLTIPPGYIYRDPLRIVVAVNEAERSHDMYKPVFDIARLFDSTIHLAAFARTDADAFELVTQSHVLTSLERSLSFAYPEAKLETVSLPGSGFEEAFGNLMKENFMDLLVMITRERSFWRLFLEGSLTREMSYLTSVPLLSLHRLDSGRLSVL